jgi:hypothetical protein
MHDLSIRAFAKLDGCDESLVRRALRDGHLVKNPNGKLDASLAGGPWRKRNRIKADEARTEPDKSADNDVWGAVQADASAPDDDAINVQAAKLVRTHEHTTLAEALRRKEVALMVLRELEAGREQGKLVPIEDSVAECARSHLIVRNLLLSLGAKLAPTLAPMKDVEQVKAAIDAEIAKVFASLGEDRDE